MADSADIAKPAHSQPAIEPPAHSQPAIEPPAQNQPAIEPPENRAANTADNKEEIPQREEAPAGATGAALDSMHIAIDFRLGEVRLPVNELRNLAAGSTLTDLPGILYPRVLALAGGKVFAEGELVEIDGRIGLRILKLTGEPVRRRS